MKQAFIFLATGFEEIEALGTAAVYHFPATGVGLF